MKRQLCLILALIMAILMLAACTPIDKGTDTATDTKSSENGGTTTDTDEGGNTQNPPSDTDTDVNGGDETPNEPSNPDVGGDEEEPSEPTEVEISVSKTAAEMAAYLGKYDNGDIVSDGEIKLDSNIFVSFGKGTANTEPALYSEAIRIYQNGGTLTVSAKNGREIKTVIITVSEGKAGNGKLVISNESRATVNGNTVTVTPSELTSTVTITVGGANKTDRLYVESIEVVYMGQSGDDIAPEEPDTGDGGSGGDDGEYLYYDFTADEKNTYNSYVGLIIPFLPNNDYYIESYDEGGYRGVYFSALCESEASFTWYLAMFSSYQSDGTETDDYGDTWYLYSKNDVYIDICYYLYDGAYYVDVDAYSVSSDDGGDTTNPDDPDVGDDGDEGEYLYYDFTAGEKNTYNSYVGLIVPFLPNNDYYIESYDEGGYRGVYFSALCESEASFTWYLAMFSSYQSDGTETDDYGDTWYLYSKNDVYIDICYYLYDGAYYVDVDAYCESSGGSGEGGGSGDSGNSGASDENVITNAGVGLPEDDGDGIYDVNFKDTDKVKDVTDQGYYLDGCPTTGSVGVLVIPVEFSDRLARDLGYNIDNIKNAFEKDGKNDYYSVYDYYYISSMGQLTLDITVVDEWFCPSKPSTYYANSTMNYNGDEVLIGDQLIMDEALACLAKVMDLSKYDSDSNGTIDSVVLVTTLEIDPDTDFYWAYRYWNIYTDSEDYYYEYDGVSANDYLWASYEFIHEDLELNNDYSDTTIINPYTFIHEFAHILGAEDYYDTAYIGSPLDGHDMMDSMLGDHNAYTKFNFGWITSSRLVVTDTAVTLTLEDFSKNGDTIILANNFDPTLGVYQEYYILVYYTESDLNSEMGGYFDESGIVVYHVNASLFCEEYEGETYYDVYNNNTDAEDEYGTENNLIELVASDDGYVYLVGDTMISVTDDLGNVLGYTFTVDELSGTEATITVSAK